MELCTRAFAKYLSNTGCIWRSHPTIPYNSTRKRMYSCTGKMCENCIGDSMNIPVLIKLWDLNV